MGEPRVGIIGGSGLYELEGLTDVRWHRVRTPFGDPSDAYCIGRLGDREIVFLPRHGRGHRLHPSELPFRANIYGMKALGVEWVISVSAVGSMRERIAPLDLVIPDQFYDHTKRRISSFFEEGIVAHVAMAEPVCPDLAGALHAAAAETGATVHRGGTYLCIEGPQFSTKGRVADLPELGRRRHRDDEHARGRSWRARPSSATRRSRSSPTTTSGTRPRPR